ncbi:MAG TPA: penicillin-binding protein 1C [Gammaproteobacteria bacterium]|nr:penicillin-binding protein 1C [Gammaproteobacteria bacterium]
MDPGGKRRALSGASALSRALRRRRILIPALALAAAGAFLSCLPQPLFSDPLSAVLLDRDGQLLGARIAADQQWRFPELETLPEKYRAALLEFEDKRFYMHPGVDPLALARAAWLNFKHRRTVSGGSTISMQVIRLARENRERSYLEKLIEIVLALRLELRYSKQEILALYASHAPFGGNVVGLEAASWRYFGRTPDRLSWAESCMLAVLPNSPGLIHPGRNRDALRDKRDRLLRRLHEQGRLDALELRLALAEPLPARPVTLPRAAPHLLETLLARRPAGSLRFSTTLDRRLQLAAQDIVARHARELGAQGIHNVAALVIDNETSEVLAYVGNSFTEIADTEGMAVDIVQRPRSTGSALKPFLFAAMLQAGEILPRTLVPDVPAQYAGYMPENYDRRYRGAVPAQVALAKSLNVPAVYMLHRYGVDRFYDFLRHMGMSTLFRKPDEYGLTLILGGAEGSLWDLASMYSNLALIATWPVAYPAATYKELKILRNETAVTQRAVEVSPAVAWMTMNALLEVNRPGIESYWRNFNSSRKIAWKTGTSYGLRDAWSIGMTARNTVAVWAGNADGAGNPALTGLNAAAPVMFDLFEQFEPAEWFARPVSHMKQVEVCRNDGFLANGHCETETMWIPEESHFQQVSTNNITVHLDAAGRWRVHGRCEQVDRMRHRDWFVLPAGQEHYYKRTHADYAPLPDYRSDCRALAALEGEKGPIDLLYPNSGARIYIPTDLAGRRSRTVFEAVHRDSGAVLYWHLDDAYLGATRTIHQQALDMEPGIHRIVLVDQEGNRLARVFEVLGKTPSGAPPQP